MCIIFCKSFRYMTNNYYLKQLFPMCEVRLKQISAKNPRLIYGLIRFSSKPYI